eukprot:SAG25_NODE_729_length_5691_cov_223.244234_11_plen_418_part_00
MVCGVMSGRRPAGAARGASQNAYSAAAYPLAASRLHGGVAPTAQPRPFAAVAAATGLRGTVGAAGYSLSVSPATQLRNSGTALSVAVSSPTPNNGSHWLGMFLSDANVTAIEKYRGYCPPGGCAPTTPPWTTTAPLKFWVLADAKTLSVFRVHVINYRKPVFFAVFASTEQPKIVTRSLPLSFARMKCEPTGVHLSRTSAPGQLRATWQSGEPSGASLRWRRAGDEGWAQVPATSSTYTRGQLCGIPANMSIGYHDAGFIHTAIFDVGRSSQAGDQAFEYVVGSANCSSDSDGAYFSPVYTAKALPQPKDNVSVLFVGDMGEAPRDSPMSNHHWQMPQPTEVVDAMIASSNEVDYDGVWHVGDLAYATGYGSIWDGFMKQIEPLATRMPYCESMHTHGTPCAVLVPIVLVAQHDQSV